LKSSFHDKRKRRQNEEQQELDELRQEVFNLPDNIERGVFYLLFFSSTKKNEILFLIEETENEENNVTNKENVTERLAATRQTKFNQLWNELLDKISELNQVFKLQQKKERLKYSFL